MKKLFFGLFVCLLLISVAVFAYPEGECGHGERMIEQLNLNEEQAVEFREIMQEKHEEMHAYRKTQHEEAIEQLYLVLTVEQMEEFKQINESRIQHKKEKCKIKQ